MSVAPAIPAPSSPAASRTWQQFRQALIITAWVVAAGGVGYVVEKGLFQPRRRFLESPAEVMMRALGVAHFLIGWLFLLTSPRLRNGPALTRLAFWTLVGAGVCWGYSLLGGSKAPLPLFGFYALFLIHEVRDERGMAAANGDLPADRAFAHALAHTVAAGLITLLGGMYILREGLLHPDRLPELPAAAILLGWGAMLAVSAALAWRAGRIGRIAHGSLRQALDANSPLVSVYGVLGSVLAVGSFFGSFGLQLVILIHVAAWLVFVTGQLRDQAGRPDLRAPAAGRTYWFRTPAGFLALHLGLGLFIFILLGIRVQIWERAGLASELLSSSSFAYWSLMHICMGFARR